MTGYLTTHVLDTARGCPAAGLKIELFRINGDVREKLASLVTNADGRTDHLTELTLIAREILIAPETADFLDQVAGWTAAWELPWWREERS